MVLLKRPILCVCITLYKTLLMERYIYCTIRDTLEVNSSALTMNYAEVTMHWYIRKMCQLSTQANHRFHRKSKGKLIFDSYYTATFKTEVFRLVSNEGRLKRLLLLYKWLI